MEQTELIMESQFEHLGGFNWRVFVICGDRRFSKVVQCQGHPSHENIVLFFKQKYKEFDIEV